MVKAKVVEARSRAWPGIYLYIKHPEMSMVKTSSKDTNEKKPAKRKKRGNRNKTTTPKNKKRKLDKRQKNQKTKFAPTTTTTLAVASAAGYQEKCLILSQNLQCVCLCYRPLSTCIRYFSPGISKWTEEDVQDWLAQFEYGNELRTFCTRQKRKRKREKLDGPRLVRVNKTMLKKNNAETDLLFNKYLDSPPVVIKYAILQILYRINALMENGEKIRNFANVVLHEICSP